jgi:hypothetical protein
MVKEIQTQRDGYKRVYDQLLKFQEDTCAMDAPSVSWFRSLMINIQGGPKP